MNVVLRHIEYLLSIHDCVVIPGFGAFIAAQKEASLDVERHTFTAPCRRFTFNEAIKESDGLLVNSIARSLGISYGKASKYVFDAVSEFKKELVRNGEFSFGRIGRVQTTLMGLLQFVPYSIDRISPLSNWIGTLSVSRFDTGSLESEERTEADIATSGKMRFKNFVRTSVGVAAAILIAIIVSTPVSVKNGYNASTVIPITAPKNVVLPEPAPVAAQINPVQNVTDTTDAVITGEVVKLPEELQDSVPLKKREHRHRKYRTEETSVAERVPIVNNLPPRFNENDEYVLVVASLISLSDAALFIANNQSKCGLELKITEVHNKFRVYAATGGTLKEAKAQASNPQIKKYFKKSWATQKNG